uniref:Uncharacterized protein n=1 Tax=Xiphophorus maculatus TaxID=8083 RepID=A0A3B5QHZ3_XIPMA
MLFDEEMIRKILNTVNPYNRRNYNFRYLIFGLLCTVYKDGATKSLMNLTGTIPVMFSGN